MNLFDRLVEQAMQSEQALGTVRPALEKELLHHDILREMSRNGLLTGLTFFEDLGAGRLYALQVAGQLGKLCAAFESGQNTVWV